MAGFQMSTEDPNNVVNGTIVLVTRGSTNAGLWELSTPNPIVVSPNTSGGSNITFTAYSATSAAAILGSVCTTAGGIFDYNGSTFGCLAPPVSSPAFLMGNVGGVPSYVTTLASLPGTGGTLTLPAGPDTITGNAATDTFTNKTFDTGATGNVLKINGSQISSVSGNTSKVATASGTLTNTHCVSIDGNGNFVDAGGACTTGGGGGTVSSGTQYQIAYYTGTGTVVGGESSLATDAHGVLNIGAGTITSNDPALSVTQTWNSSGTTFSGIFENITSTASASGSLLENLQVGGTTKWSIDKNGDVTSGSWEGSVINSSYLPTATSGALGIMEVGSNLSVSGGVVSVPAATTSALGVVSTDGATITNSSGAIACATGTTSQLGCLKPDGSTITVSSGTISAAPSGGLKLLATVNASGQSSVTFSSAYITSTYNKYVIEFDSVNGWSNSGAVMALVVSTNNGSSWLTSGYVNKGGVGGSISATAYLDLTNGASVYTGTGASVQGTIKFSLPSASRYTNFNWETDGANGGGTIGGPFMVVAAGWNASSTAINAIKIYDPVVGATFNGNFHLYALLGS